ncbi:accessory gene regulator B family protein [Clostridium carnis]
MNKKENISLKIANKLATELNLDNEKRDVINYGIFTAFQIFLSIFLAAIVGMIFNVLVETLIVSFTIAILRKYSGGAHASTSNRCIIVGTVISVGIPIIIKKVSSLNILIIVVSIIFIFSYYIIFKLAPVDSKAKPIKKEEKRIRLKRNSIVILSIYLLIVTINILLYILLRNNKFIVYSLCICGGVFWQVLTLTKFIHNLMKSMEDLINKIIS